MCIRDSLYRMIFLLGLASILLLPIVLAGQAAIAGYTCSVIMYQLVFLLIWVIAASAFRDRSAYAPGFFGLVYGFWSLGSFGGALFLSLIHICAGWAGAAPSGRRSRTSRRRGRPPP